MLREFLTKEDIQLCAACHDWEEALALAAAPLLRRKAIEPSYLEAIKKNHRAMPYMVIAPGIMLAHARPECGAHEVGITFLTLKEPVFFGSRQNDPVRLVILFATPDATSHLRLLESLTEFLMSPAHVDALLSADSVQAAWESLE